MYQLNSVYLTFILSYFNSKSDIFISTLSLLPFYVARGVFYDDSGAKLVTLAIVTMIWHSLTLFVTHLATVKMGMLVAENALLQLGNESVFDNLNERVIILEETSKRIIYSNMAKADQSRD